jgi:hypothetical protein
LSFAAESVHGGCKVPPDFNGVCTNVEHLLGGGAKIASSSTAAFKARLVFTCLRFTR